MELLAVIYVAGILFYFTRTSERQRENHLLIVWGLLLIPCIIGLVRLALP